MKPRTEVSKRACTARCKKAFLSLKSFCHSSCWKKPFGPTKSFLGGTKTFGCSKSFFWHLSHTRPATARPATARPAEARPDPERTDSDGTARPYPGTPCYVVCVTSGCAKHRFTRFQTPETHAIHYQFTNTPMDRAISSSTKHQWANPSCDKAQAVHQHSSSPTPRSQEIQWQKNCAYKWSWAFRLSRLAKWKFGCVHLGSILKSQHEGPFCALKPDIYIIYICHPGLTPSDFFMVGPISLLHHPPKFPKKVRSSLQNSHSTTFFFCPLKNFEAFHDGPLDFTQIDKCN